jgi:hypothetical protein
MKDADDLNDIFVDAIDRKVWRTAEDEFAGIPLASVFIHVIADRSEVVCGSVRPADVHEPGYRFSIIFLTSA